MKEELKQRFQAGLSGLTQAYVRLHGPDQTAKTQNRLQAIWAMAIRLHVSEEINLTPDPEANILDSYYDLMLIRVAGAIDVRYVNREIKDHKPTATYPLFNPFSADM